MPSGGWRFSRRSGINPDFSAPSCRCRSTTRTTCSSRPRGPVASTTSGGSPLARDDILGGLSGLVQRNLRSASTTSPTRSSSTEPEPIAGIDRQARERLDPRTPPRCGTARLPQSGKVDPCASFRAEPHNRSPPPRGERASCAARRSLHRARPRRPCAHAHPDRPTYPRPYPAPPVVAALPPGPSRTATRAGANSGVTSA